MYLISDNSIYDELSIIIPDSDNLSKSEFYINPNISEEIIDTLINENFIQSSGKKSIAGNKETISYKIL